MAQEVEALRERLSALSQASLRINRSLDFPAVLQGVLDSARSLTGASYSPHHHPTTLDQGGQVEDFLVSGLSAEESRQLWELPEGVGVKGGEKVYHCGGGIVYHRHGEKGLNWEPAGKAATAGHGGPERIPEGMPGVAGSAADL